jgi:S-adenosylmethionine:tRNA ribosyltransferase-isomerase
MKIPSDLKIENYTYELPDERIAKYPLANRDQSKLLIFNEHISEDIFVNIAEHLPAPALLVTNNTKVIRARMEFFKSSGARIEIFCLEPWNPIEYYQMFIQNARCSWVCYIGNSKKWKNGPLSKTIEINGKHTELTIHRSSTQKDAQIIDFNWDNPTITFGEILDHTGQVPIPPYLNRPAEDSDTERYQTVYSKYKGSVAAPTAGLHFTESVFASLTEKGIKQHEVTLHVGAGTFKPVLSNTIGGHPMHTEHFIISKEIIEPIVNNQYPLIAVGTTSVRTLESMYWIGVKLLQNPKEPLELGQWEAYILPQDVPVNKAFEALLQNITTCGTNQTMANTSIMIAPGYSFKVVDYLITNFHQPQSTLLLLIAAFIGEQWKNLYQYALENRFRFLSYGDSCLLKKK